MDVSPFTIRLADGLAEAQHSRFGKSNESDHRVAAQMPDGPCKFSFRDAPAGCMLPNVCDRFISSSSSLEPGRDLHDFSVFADRALASDVHAGRLPQFLRATAVSIDRA
jgi:hypothetical protein